jgi:hypothetical protein
VPYWNRYTQLKKAFSMQIPDEIFFDMEKKLEAE